MRVFFKKSVLAPWRVFCLASLFMALFNQTLCAYAGVATPNCATLSDASHPDRPVSGMVFSVAQNEIAPTSSLASITNTVNYAGVRIVLFYYDMSNVIHRSSVQVASDGSFTIARPADYAKLQFIKVELNRVALPSIGKYTFSADFMSHTGGFDYLSFYLYADKLNTNASSESKYTSISFNQSSGDYYFTTAIEVGSDLNSVFYNYSIGPGFSLPYGGYLKFNFTKLPSDSKVDFSTPGTSDADKQASNSGNISNINSNVEGISSSLNTFSSSLLSVVRNFRTDFNNFTGTFTDTYEVLFTHMRNQATRIVSAIENIHVEFGEFAQEIIDNDNKLHEDQLANDNRLSQEQLANDNKNHENLVNGYDKSNMDASSNKLSSALDRYENKESELIGSVSGYIDHFTYSDPFSKFTAPLADVSYFLTGIYTGLGALNIPIAFSLTLSIGLICIGWYRFRGG